MLRSRDDRYFSLLDDALASQRAAAWPRFLPSSLRDVGWIEESDRVVRRLPPEARCLLVVGMGGALTNPRAVITALCPEAVGRRIVWLDHLDDGTVARCLADLAGVPYALMVASKSGHTVETLAIAALVWQSMVASNGEQAAARATVMVTSPGDRPLRRWAESVGCAVLDHPPDVSGRFALFSPITGIPAAWLGVDLRPMVAASYGWASAQLADPWQDPQGGLGSLAGWLLEQWDRSAGMVCLAYGDCLEGWIEWVSQLLAESLGKQGRGITPIRARGPMDQHSQFQLYLDGPRDKAAWVWSTVDPKDGLSAGTLEAHDWLPEALHHQSLGRILCAEAEASVESLRAQSVPVVWWHASPLTASLLGEWMTSVMLAVAVVGRAVGVSAFDQPAVDDIKRRMVVLLGSSPRR